MKNKLLIGIFIVPLLTVVTLVIGIYLIIATETGTQWLAKISAGFLPESIILSGVEGRLLDDLIIHHIQYTHCENVTELNNVHIIWDPIKLFNKVFKIQEATLDSASISLVKQCQDKKETQFPDEIRLPFEVVLDNFIFNNITIKNKDKNQYIDQVQGGIFLQGGNFELKDFSIRSSQYQVKASFNGELHKPFKSYGDIQWSFIDKNKTSWKGQIEINGDINEIYGKHVLQQPLQVDSEITVIQPLQELKLTAENKWSTLALPIEQDSKIILKNGNFKLEGDLTSVSFALTANASSHQLPSIANLQLKGNVDSDGYEISKLVLLSSEYQITASLNGKLKHPFQAVGDIQWNLMDKNKTLWKGQIELNGDVNEIHGKHVLRQPLHVNSNVTVFNLLQELKIVANNSWSSIALPIGQEPKITFENGQLLLEGNLDSVSFMLDANAISQQLPSVATMHIEGIANQEVITISDMQISGDQEALSGIGKITLKPTVNVAFSLQGKQFNPEFVIAELPGMLNFDADILASRSQQGIEAAINLKSLAGTLRNYKVRGGGKLNYSHDQVHAEQFNISIGENLVQIDGLLGADNNKAEFEVVAKNLSQLHPQYSGRMVGKGSIQGPIKAPKVQAIISGEQIKINNRLSVANVSINGDVHVFSDNPSNAKIQASNIIVNDKQINRIDLLAKGNQKQHKVELAIQGQDIQSTFYLTGSYINDTWKANINRMQADVPAYGKWKLVRQSDIQYSPHGFSLSDTCLSSQRSSICVGGQSDTRENWQARGKITDFPLQLLAKNTEKHLTIEGVGDLEFNLHGNSVGFEGDIQAYSKGTTLRSAFLEEHDESLLIKQLELIGNINSARSRFDLNIEMDKGKASGFAIVENINDREKAFIREANLEADIPSVSFLNVLLPTISVKEGSLYAQSELHGFLKQPKIKSNAKLSGLKFNIPDLGTEYTNGELITSSAGWSSFDLKGALQSQNGKLAVVGKIHPQDELSYSINLKGENFEVLHLPDKSLVISPNLDINGSTSNLNVEGVIEIPSANLVLKELPKGTVTRSSDQVFVSEQGDKSEEKGKKVFDVTGKIQLKFGEGIHFAGKGIQTDLIGELLVQLGDERIPSGQGVLEFKNASYQVLGQTLDISSGKMLFAGPINNPDLDVKVTRQSGDVTAGIKIQGTVKKPNTQVFSSPIMSDGNALSYLISGRPLAEASESQNALLAKAALSLGVDSSGSITQQIGSSVGLDELSVSGGEDLESTSLILGKYLSPRLYLSYAYGLFASAGTVELDYQLTNHISVEADSGEEQAIDLIYTIERN